MAEHYCEEHRTVRFKRGRMKSYAHPIEDTDPVEWCNEEEPHDMSAPKPQGYFGKPEPQKKSESTMSKAEWRTKELAQRLSIEAQVALKCAVKLVIADKLEIKAIPQSVLRSVEILESVQSKGKEADSDPGGDDAAE